MGSLNWINSTILEEVNDLTSTLWIKFLQQHGPELFKHMLQAIESAEQLSIEFKIESFQGREVSPDVAQLILVHTVIKTMTLASAFHNCLAEHEREDAL